MEFLQEIINNNIHLAPLIIFLFLLLAGLNVPVSEDAMIFISAILSFKHPHLTPYFFIGVYAGAYFSDLICYWLGRILGPKLWTIKHFENIVHKDKIRVIHHYYDKYGMITLFIGRFIPFGVRNGLFLTAGLGKMNFLKFSIADLCACTITTVLYFTLYFKYGNNVIEYVKKGNLILFAIVALIVTTFIVYKKVAKKNKR